MSQSSLFLLEAFVIVILPVVLLRISRLKGLVPLVVVQILVGIAMGPTVFGRIAPDYFHTISNPTTLSSFSGIATIGVLIFGMISGLHLDPGILKDKERGFWPIAIANVAVPMVLGCAAGCWILVRHPDELLSGVSRVEFVAAIGISVSMKALPVLGAILGEMSLLGQRVGNLALGIAGINDLILWTLLGVLLTVGASHVGDGHGLPPAYLLIFVPTYLVLMVKLVRPALDAMIASKIQDEAISMDALLLIGAATIGSALATELMGLHYIIGAFLLGVVMPARLRESLIDRLQMMTVALLMPFFFTLTGMRTFIDLSSPILLEIFIITFGAATLGIVGGTVGTARFFDEKWSFAFGLGSLLQSKGLTELIVLYVLMDAHIISPIIFSAMILVALVSTAFAMPMARFVLRWEGDERTIKEPAKATA
jgi:Kef-type K+ transport system membrane component KefB